MQDVNLQKAQIYTEFEGLNALKTQARTDKKGALEAVAKQFESLFLSEMVKSMRKASDVFSEGNYFNSQQSEFYRDMFDNQLSLTLSQRQGAGIAEALVRQLSRQIPGLDGEGNPLSGHKGSLADYERRVPVLSTSLPQQLETVNQVVQKTGVTSSVAEEAREPLPTQFESPEQFIRQLLPMAERASEQSGIDPKVMIAQAALETGWGRFMIEGRDGSPSHNLFGIKADQRWAGESVEVATTEYREGIRMAERADFRAYPDYEASFRDYVAFLESNPRYRHVLSAADQPDVFAERLQEAGYATDPNYGMKIRRIMNNDAMTTLSMGDRGAEE